MNNAEIQDKVRGMPREHVQKVLESYGFGVYDSEETEVLRLALISELVEGVIDPDVLDLPIDQLADPRDR